MITDAATATAHIEVLLEYPCTVYCGRYLNASSVADVSPWNLRLQNFVQHTSTTNAVVHMTGLVSNVAYDIYCMTTTYNDAFQMALANILETRTTLTPSCCREDFTVDLVSTYELLSSYQHKLVSLSVGRILPIYQAIRVDMSLVPIKFGVFSNETLLVAGRRLSTSIYANFTLSDCVKGLTLNPSSVVIPSIQKSKTFEHKVFIGSLCPGRFVLNITAYDIGIHDVSPTLPIQFPNGNVFDIATDNGSAPSPQLKSARFVLSGEVVELRFDSYTDMGGLGGVNFICSDLLWFAGAASAECRWHSNTRLVVTSGVSHLNVYDNITLREGVIASAYVAHMFAPGVVVPVFTAITVLPKVVVSTAAQVHNCSSFILDLSASTGSGGKPWQQVAILVRSMSYNDLNATHTTIPVDINEFYASMYDINVATALPVGYLQSNTRYFFDIKLCTAWSKCDRTTYKIEVANVSLPSVLIEGSAYKVMTTSTPLRLSAFPVMSACEGNMLSPSEFKATYAPTYTWTLFDLNGTVSVLEVVQTLTYSPSLQLPPHTLMGGGLYKVRLVLSLFTPLGVYHSTSLCYITVSKDSLRAVTSPDGSVVVPYGGAVVINASSSFDMDVAGSATEQAREGLSFNWTCVSLEVDKNLTSSGLDCQDIMFVGASHRSVELRSLASHAGALYLVTLSLTTTHDDRFDQTSIEVAVEADCCTSLNIPVNGLVNSQVVFDLVGSVSTSLGGTARWSLLETPSLSLRNMTIVSLTQDITVFRVQAVTFYSLRFAPFVLSPGNSYTFQLEYTSASGGDYRSTAITLTANDLPKPGIFVATPETGVELLTNFVFMTSLWSDEQLPLSYYFAYYSEDGQEVTIKSQNAETRKNVLLLRGYSSIAAMNLSDVCARATSSSSCLPCFMTAYDHLGAYNSLELSVTVNTSALNASVLSTLFETFLNDTITVDEVIDGLPVAVACNLAPLCGLLNREACSSVEHTCGLCLAGNYLGASGHHNTFCFNDTLITPGVHHCYLDGDCPSAGWTCDAASFTCLQILQVCAETCEPHGDCLFLNHSVDSYLEVCYVDDTSCSAVCVCHAGYFGGQCSIAEAELVEVAATVEAEVCGYAFTLAADDFKQGDVNVIAVLTFIGAYYREPFKVSIKAAQCMVTVITYISYLNASETPLTRAHAEVMFRGMDMCFGLERLYDYNPQLAEENQAGREDLLRSLSTCLPTYCELITSDAYAMMMAQREYTTDSSRLFLTAVLLDAGHSTAIIPLTFEPTAQRRE